MTSTIHHQAYLLGDEIKFFVGQPGGKLDVLTECWATLTAHGKSVAQSEWPCRRWMREVKKKKNSFTSNTWAWHQSNQKQPNSSFVTSKWNPLLQMRGSSVKGSLKNPKCQPRALVTLVLWHFCSSSIILLAKLLVWHQNTSKKIWEHQATNQEAVRRWGGRQACGTMRSSEGKNNKDNDHRRKLCCRHIKLSTHSLGRVSAGLGMKTLNPTVA